MKHNKLFLSVIICAAVFLLSGKVFAMTLSKPVYVGEISVEVQSPGGGYVIKGATSNDGNYFTDWIKENKNYGKGVAVFGSGYDALYCHYDFYNQLPSEKKEKFGAKDLSDTVDVVVWHNGSINKIDTNEGVTLYAIRYDYCTAFTTLIGRTKEGKWVKYFDTEEICRRYKIPCGYKENGGIVVEQAKAEGDTLIIPYHKWYYSGESYKTVGEFRFKWDDNAKWFGVQNVTY